jgi:hypothetical protein
MSSNPAHVEVYSEENYVTKIVSNLRQDGGFLRVVWYPPRYSSNIDESGVEHHKPKL